MDDGTITEDTTEETPAVPEGAPKTPTQPEEVERVEPPAVTHEDIIKATEPLYAAVYPLRDALLALRDITIHGSGLIQYSSVLKVFDDSIANIDDILRAA